MTKYVGLDWARKGWFGVILKENGDYDFDLFPSILNVWANHHNADLLLIDIPIGLRNDGRRTCDEEAEEILKPHRQNSVFSTPIRDAVYAKTLEKAKKQNERYGFSISNQAWSICLRIREVDKFLDEFPEAIGRMRESHPEICFAALDGGRPIAYRKNTEVGLENRKEILFGEDDSLEKVFDDAVETFIEPPSWARRLSKNAEDDVLDALVLAHTARQSEEELATLPVNPNKDNTKENPLPIGIVYPRF